MLSSTPFLLSKTFLLSKFSPPLFGSPCFQWFRLPGVICDPTWPQCKETHKFLHYFKVGGFYGLRFLANPCFQWFRFKYNIRFIENNPFIKISPPLGSPCFQVQHSFWSKTFLLSKLTPPPLAAHAFKYTIPFIKNIPFIKISPPPFWQPMLSMIQVTRGHLRPYLTSV